MRKLRSGWGLTVTTYLLHEHDDFGGHHGTPVSWNSNHLLELVVPEDHAFFLGLKESVHIENISGRLNLAVAEFAHALIRVKVSSFAHVPARRLGT